MSDDAPKIRVLLVDDSRTVRAKLADVIEGGPGFELVGEAENGLQAFELCRKLRPDVVAMDIVMPEMNGLKATEQIMAFCPTPILIVSSSHNRGELFQTYDALAAGAVDALDKSPDSSPDDWDSRFLSALRIVSRVKVITHPRGRLNSLNKPVTPNTEVEASTPRQTSRCKFLAIGASTGGPSAVAEILSALPANFEAPILLVLHIGETFGASLASWLDSQSPLPVRYPRDGEKLCETRGVLMAPPSHHMVVKGGRLLLSDAPEKHSCRPSIDLLFESLAREVAPQTCAALLTGMGRDGAAGLLALRQSGARTIAQDESTCTIYGMPREAVLLGAAQSVLPLARIAPALVNAVRGKTDIHAE